MGAIGCAGKAIAGMARSYADTARPRLQGISPL